MSPETFDAIDEGFILEQLWLRPVEVLQHGVAGSPSRNHCSIACAKRDVDRNCSDLTSYNSDTLRVSSEDF